MGCQFVSIVLRGNIRLQKDPHPALYVQAEDTQIQLETLIASHVVLAGLDWVHRQLKNVREIVLEASTKHNLASLAVLHAMEGFGTVRICKTLQYGLHL
jgi:hypothetical protein